MQKVLKGEKVSLPSDTHIDSVVTKHHVTEHKILGNVVLKWALNFEDVSREELEMLASRHLVIALRPQFKSTPEKEAEDWEDKEFSIREWLDTKKRERVSGLEKAKSLLPKLSAADRAALIAELQGDAS